MYLHLYTFHFVCAVKTVSNTRKYIQRIFICNKALGDGVVPLQEQTGLCLLTKGQNSMRHA